MAVTQPIYVQEREGVLYVGDTRVALSSLIAAWRAEGYTAEELQLAFPALTLAQVYGAVAYYLDHQLELDAAVIEDARLYAKQRLHDRAADPGFYQQLDDRRARLRLDMDRSNGAKDGLDGVPDADILSYAAQHDLILLTHDVRTMPGHFAAFLATLKEGEFSPGIWYTAQTQPVGVAIGLILETWLCSDHDEYRNRELRLP